MATSTQAFKYDSQLQAMAPFERVCKYADFSEEELVTVWSNEKAFSYLRSLFIKGVSYNSGNVPDDSSGRYTKTYDDVPGTHEDRIGWWKDFLTEALKSHGLFIAHPHLKERLERAESSIEDVNPGGWKECVEKAVRTKEFWYNDTTGSRNPMEVLAIRDSCLDVLWEYEIKDAMLLGKIDLNQGFQAADESVGNKLLLLLEPSIKWDIDFGDEAAVKNKKESVSDLEWYVYLMKKAKMVTDLDTGDRDNMIHACETLDKELGLLFWDELIGALRSSNICDSPLIYLDFRKLRNLRGCLCRLALISHSECKKASNWFRHLPEEESPLLAQAEEVYRDDPDYKYMLQTRWKRHMNENIHIDVVMLPGQWIDVTREDVPTPREWLSFICPEAARRWLKAPDEVPTCDILQDLPTKEWLSHGFDITKTEREGLVIDNNRVLRLDWRETDGRCIECMQTAYVDRTGQDTKPVENYFNHKYGKEKLLAIEFEENQPDKTRLAKPTGRHFRHMEYFKKGFERLKLLDRNESYLYVFREDGDQFAFEEHDAWNTHLEYEYQRGDLKHSGCGIQQEFFEKPEEKPTEHKLYEAL